MIFLCVYLFLHGLMKTSSLTKASREKNDHTNCVDEVEKVRQESGGAHEGEEERENHHYVALLLPDLQIPINLGSLCTVSLVSASAAGTPSRSPGT